MCEWICTGRTETVVFVVNVLCAEILILKIYSIYHPVKSVIPSIQRTRHHGFGVFLVFDRWTVSVGRFLGRRLKTYGEGFLYTFGLSVSSSV